MICSNVRTFLFAFVLCLLGRNASAVELEAPSPRQGYYLSVSQHVVGLGVWNRGQADDLRVGSGGGLRLGQMLTSRFGLGMMLVESNVTKSSEDETLFVGLFALEAQLRVWKTLAVSAGSGLGFAQVTQKNPIDPDDKTEGAYGAYTTLGISYDFFPYRKAFSGGLAISPVLRFRYLPGSPLDVLGVALGVEFTWWTGLPKNQLDLPPDRAF